MKFSRYKNKLAFFFYSVFLISVPAFSSTYGYPDVHSTQRALALDDLEIKMIDEEVTGCPRLEYPIRFKVLNHSDAILERFVIEVIMLDDTIRQDYYWLVRSEDSATLKFRDGFFAKTGGDYPIQIRIDTADVNVSNNTSSMVFHMLEEPVADFEVEDVCDGEEVHFINRSTYSEIDSLKYYWRFGDPQASSLKNPKYSYRLSTKGVSESFHVTLVVSGGTCRDSVAKVVTVHAAPDPHFDAELINKKLSITNQATTDPTGFQLWEFGDGKRSVDHTPTHTYASVGYYLVCKTTTSSMGLGCKDTACKLLGPSAIVQGRVYVDLNGNCIYDGADLAMNSTVTVDSSLFAKSTTAYGKYRLLVSAGDTQTFRATAHNSLLISCSSNPYILRNSQVDSAYNHDFIFKIDSSKVDQQISVGSARWTRGRQSAVYLQVYSKSYSPEKTLEVEFVYNDTLSIVESSLPYTRIGKGKIRLKIERPALFKWASVKINLLDTAAVLRSNHKLTFSAKFVKKDSFPENDADTLKTRITGPFDPNAKTAYPQGALTERPDEMRYLIEFQNIGSADAQDVVVYDYLDSRLPVEDIYVTGTSHPDNYSMSIDNNVLKWTFKNIYLPDSASDPEGSKGFVMYTTATSPSFKSPGDTIHNKATIYFDFEDGIETNTASIYIVDKNSSVPERIVLNNNLEVYPNPASDELTVENQSSENQHIAIHDLKGSVIKVAEVTAGEEQTIDISLLKSGLYILRDEAGHAVRFLKR